MLQWSRTWMLLLCAFSLQAHAIWEGQTVAANTGLARTTVLVFSFGPDNSTGSICSGTVLSSRHVVLAGHCLINDPDLRGQTFVRFIGGLSAPVDIRAQKIFIHPNYFRSPGVAPDPNDRSHEAFDIGLITLAQSIPAGVAIADIADYRNLESNYLVGVAGFGQLGLASRTTPINVLPLSFATLRVGQLGSDIISLNPLGEGIPLPGDSGGPAYVVFGNQLKVWGVAIQVYGPSLANGEMTQDPRQFLGVNVVPLAPMMPLLNQLMANDGF